MAVGLGNGPERARQAQRERAQPGLAGHAVDGGVARLGEAQPDLAVQPTHEVVGVAGQVVQQHLGLCIPTLGDVEILRAHGDFPDAVLAGFVDEQVLLVAAQRHAVGEAQAPGHHAHGAAGGVVLQHAAGGGLLQDVEHAGLEGAAPVLGREAGGGVAEVDLAVPGHHHAVGVADRIVADAVGQHLHLALRRNRQQALDGIGRDEVPGRVEIEAQHPAAGVDEDLLRRAVRAHAQDVAAEHRGVELAVLADGDVLGADLAAQVDHLQVRQAQVGCVRPLVARRVRGLPGHGGDGHGPGQQVGQAGHYHGAQADEQLLEHARLLQGVSGAHCAQGCQPLPSQR